MELDTFEFGPHRFRWGTRRDELLAALPQLEPKPILELTWTRALGFAITAAHARAPATGRPVLTVNYRLAAVDGVLDRLEHELGPARADDGDAIVRRRWQVGQVGVSAVIPWASEPGALALLPDEEWLAAPYRPLFRGVGAAWAQSAGELEVVVVPGLHPEYLSETELVLLRVELRRTPEWVSAGLAPEQAAIWSHPAAWGIATPEVTTVHAHGENPQLEHLRVHPARGQGRSALLTGPGRPIMEAGPGPAGLDALATRLEQLGAIIRRKDGSDE